MFEGVHGMRVCLTRLVLHLASACLYHICFALMGFYFSVYLYFLDCEQNAGDSLCGT